MSFSGACFAFALRLISSLGKLLYATRDHLSTCDCASLRPAEECRKGSAHRSLCQHQSDAGKDGEPRCKCADWCQ